MCESLLICEALCNCVLKSSKLYLLTRKLKKEICNMCESSSEDGSRGVKTWLLIMGQL